VTEWATSNSKTNFDNTAFITSSIGIQNFKNFNQRILVPLSLNGSFVLMVKGSS